MYPGTYALVTPDKPAAIMAGSGHELTYAHLEDNSARLARVLHDAGLRRGDVVALLAETVFNTSRSIGRHCGLDCTSPRSAAT